MLVLGAVGAGGAGAGAGAGAVAVLSRYCRKNWRGTVALLSRYCRGTVVVLSALSRYCQGTVGARNLACIIAGKTITRRLPGFRFNIGHFNVGLQPQAAVGSFALWISY